MSRCHKAAPTERQILEALQQRLETRKPGHWQKRLRSLLERANASSAAPALLLSHEGYDPFAAAATGICPPDETARVMLIASSPSLQNAVKETCSTILQGETLVSLSLAEQYAPSAVVLLQFMHYCDALLPMLQRLRAQAGHHRSSTKKVRAGHQKEKLRANEK
eukprot:symbB.v1.2.003358.t1/scaffold186.1/size279346/5